MNWIGLDIWLPHFYRSWYPQPLPQKTLSLEHVHNQIIEDSRFFTLWVSYSNHYYYWDSAPRSQFIISSFFFFKKKNIHLLSSKSSIYLVAFATHIWPFIFGLFTYRLSHPFDSFFNYLNKICRRQRTRVLVISPFACLEAHYFFQPNRHQAMSKLRPKSFETSIKKMDIPVLDE